MPTGPTEMEQKYKGQAKQAFDKAKAAKEPLQKSPDPKPRQGLSGKFDQAKAAKTPLQQQKQQQQQGSKMVKNSRPNPQLTPKGPLKEAGARNAHNQALAKERAEANRKIEQAKARNEAAKQQARQQAQKQQQQQQQAQKAQQSQQKGGRGR